MISRPRQASVSGRLRLGWAGQETRTQPSWEWSCRTAARVPLEALGRERDAVVAATMSLEYVARRTTCITKLIYYPFLMIGLMVLSRSSMFNSFPVDPVFMVSQLMSLLIAFASAMALRLAAEDARRKTIRQFVLEKLMTLTKHGSGGFNAQLDLLRERVANFNEGAFSPLSQQPVIRAMLLPLGSYGGTVLLSSLTGGNL